MLNFFGPKTVALIVLLAVVPFSAPGQSVRAAELDARLPPTVAAGLDAFRASGPEAAVTAWVRGGPHDGSKDALGQAASLRRVQVYFGPFDSYDVVAIRDVTPTVRLVFVVMNFKNGPLFAKFVAFKGNGSWVLTQIDFEPKHLWPLEFR